MRLTEDADGRVDDRAEKAATETEVGTATLTIRLPAAAVTPTLVALRELGDVEAVDLTKKDVTGAAQDLDARIHAMELSVARMTNLLATATTHDDIIVAENALTEREAGLEQLRSQRAAIAEQVSLSTIHVAIVGPDLPPPVEPPAPVEPPTGPQSFVEGLVTGWDSLVSVVSAIAIVVGVLLPWLAFGGAIAALVVAGGALGAALAGAGDAGAAAGGRAGQPVRPAGGPADRTARRPRPAPAALTWRQSVDAARRTASTDRGDVLVVGRPVAHRHPQHVPALPPRPRHPGHAVGQHAAP